MRSMTARSGGIWEVAVSQCSINRIDLLKSAHLKDLNEKEKL